MAMEWEQLLSFVRLSLEDEPASDPWRSQYQQDYDRVVFSSAFRRLGKKTQVHPLASNDHIHNRLTHSIEVSSVGRSLGIAVGHRIQNKLPEGTSPSILGEIVQAACLAHDIGNPPFGHAGEEAIRSWFKSETKYLEGLTENEKDDFLNFEGNAQSFRIVTKLENNAYAGGMRLTYATLATMLKYPWTTLEIKKNKKYSCFQSEKEFLDKIADGVGLIKHEDYFYCRHPLAFLAEAADDICYRILDLEDAHEINVLSFKEVLGILEPLCSKDKDYAKVIQAKDLSPRRKVSYLRGKSIGNSIKAVADAFENNYTNIMNGKFNKKKDLIEYCSEEIKLPLNNAKEIAKSKIFNQPRKIELEIGSYTSLGVLLETYLKGAREVITSGSNVSYKSDRVMKMMGINTPKKGDSPYEAMLKVTDYISGMTDSYATYMAKQVGGMAL